MSRTRSGWSPPQKPEDWLVYLFGGAAALYILCCLPSVLAPRSFFGAFVLLCTGVILGIVAVLGGLVLLFVLLTKTAKTAKIGQTQETLRELHASKSTEAGSGEDAEKRQLEHDSVVQEMLQGSGGPLPPHSFLVSGTYAGWVWSIPSSKYIRAEALVNWPPATEGPKAVATKWWGSLRGRTLYLARNSGLEQSYLVPVREVNLAECQVEVVREGLRTKSRWWRKCPIQISHASQILLHQESSFALFAEGSAAKEQWYLALMQAAGTAPARQAVEDLYVRFCEEARDAEEVQYPQMGDGFEADSSAGGSVPTALEQAAKAQPQTGKVWGRLFTKRRASPKKTVSSSQLHRPGGSSPSKRVVQPPGFLNPMELDQAWMGKSSVPGHLAAPASKQPATGIAAMEPSDDLGRVSASAASTPVHEEEEMQDPLPTLHSAPAVPLGDSPQLAGPAAGGKSIHSLGQPEDDSLQDRPAEDGPVASQTDGGSLPGINGGGVDSSSPCRTSQSGLYPAIPVEHGVNMLLVRAGFDILRSPAVHTALKAHIHRKLNELRMPDYMHGLEVVDIKIGSTVPAIHNLRALPSPTSTIWPQVMFDLDYEGDITIVVETKLDVRDGAAWSQFDKAINRLEGGNEAAMDQADVDSPAESEDEQQPSDDAGAFSPAETDEPGRQGTQKRGLIANMLPLRQRFAKGIRQLAEVTADHLSRMQLKLRLDITSLKGPLYVWMPPPPGDRLWFSFVTPPQLVASATPLVGGRLLKYSYHAGRVSQWIASKLQSSITKNMVFPSASDIPLPFLLGLDHPDVAHVPASFMPEGEPPQAGAEKGNSRKGKSQKKSPATDAADNGCDAEKSKGAQAVVSTPMPPGAIELIRKYSASSEPAGPSQLTIDGSSGPASLPGTSPSAQKAQQATEAASSSPRRGFWGRKMLPQQESQQSRKAGLEGGRAAEQTALKAAEETPQPDSQKSLSTGLGQGKQISQKSLKTATKEPPGQPGLDTQAPLKTGLGQGKQISQKSPKAATEEPQKEPGLNAQAPLKAGLEGKQHPQKSLTAATEEPQEQPQHGLQPTPGLGLQSGWQVAAQKLQTTAAQSEEKKPVQASEQRADPAIEEHRGAQALETPQPPSLRVSTKAEAASTHQAALSKGEQNSRSAVETPPSSAMAEPADSSNAGISSAGPLGREPSDSPKAQEAVVPSSEVSGRGSRRDIEGPSPKPSLSASSGPIRGGGDTHSQSDQAWTPAEVFFGQPQRTLPELQTPSTAQGGEGVSNTSSFRSQASDLGGSPGSSIASGQALTEKVQGKISNLDRPSVTESLLGEAKSETTDASGLERESLGSRGGKEGQGWQKRLNVTGSVVQKNWEAFKNRNPNTVQQGKKFAGAMEKLREQAQEQIRKTQEQMRKNQELKKAASLSKPSNKEA